MKQKNKIEDIIKYARTWIGTPYVHQGRQRKVGCDCAGFLVGIGHKFGYNPVDMHGYSPIPGTGKLKKLVASQMKEIPIDEIKPGDIVLIDFCKRGDPHHIGFITNYKGGLGLIHSYQMVGKVVEHDLNNKWKDRIKLAFRFLDIN